MATNKHATIRYHALDQCFSNFGRKYFLEDLIVACNEAIYEFSGVEDGVKRRQIFEDIKFMESEQGWSIPLQRLRDGKKVYYRYSDKSFSIKRNGINQAEMQQLKETLTILTRFEGMPQFGWLEEMRVRLENTFGLKENLEVFVGFEQNPFLKGLEHFSGIFAAIQNKTPLLLNYQGYKQPKPIEVILHPWYLKQYNTRWFLLGFNEEFNDITNLALDRILSYEKLEIDYKSNENINFDEYFEDVIGVTIKNDSPTEKIILKINRDVWPYIESKPLHGSQKLKSRTNENVLIELNVQRNHELVSKLFSYLDAIEVLEPEVLRTQFKSISERLFKKYS